MEESVCGLCLNESVTTNALTTTTTNAVVSLCYRKEIEDMDAGLDAAIEREIAYISETVSKSRLNLSQSLSLPSFLLPLSRAERRKESSGRRFHSERHSWFVPVLKAVS